MQVGMTTLISGARDAAFVRDAERLGVTSVWVPETWGQDALTPLAYLAGQTTSIRLGSSIAQLGARSPAMVAMSAMSLQLLSGGRFLLGLGVSGPPDSSCSDMADMATMAGDLAPSCAIDEPSLMLVVWPAR